MGLSRTSLLGLPGILALTVLALDQASKLLVCAIWPQPGSGQLVLIPGFLRIVHWRNPGAAWGIFSDHTWMLAALSLAAAAAIAIFFRTITEGKAILAIPFGVLLGGIIGNFIDRAFYAGGVIDFIRFEFWPAFNVADSANCCSIAFLVAASILSGRKAKSGNGEGNPDDR